MNRSFVLMAAGLLILIALITPGLDTTITEEEVELPVNSRAVLTVGAGKMYSRIQDAIDNASDGDTVQVFAGTYNENLVLNKSLNLQGNGAESSFVNNTPISPILKIESDWCNISGFCFTWIPPLLHWQVSY